MPRTFMINACMFSEAAGEAMAFAESTADPSKKWVGFEWRETSPVRFPIEVPVERAGGREPQ